MISKRIASIFRQGSRTYFFSSVFFPADVRTDVFKLYAFVRVADDFVDRVPQDAEGLDAFVGRYRTAMAGAATGDEVIDGYVDLAQRKAFDPAWTESFLAAMRQDLTKRTYSTLEEVESYMYGSAEVIGLHMARVLDLPQTAYPAARRLGTAMQYLNFLRDVYEDDALGRCYIPREVLDRFGLAAPSREAARSRPEQFAAMMRHEVGRYRRWQAEAEAGYRFLSRRYRVPIRTAADMYYWTGLTIEREPTVVFERKIRPSVPRIATRLALNALTDARRPHEAEPGRGADGAHRTAG